MRSKSCHHLSQLHIARAGCQLNHLQLLFQILDGNLDLSLCWKVGFIAHDLVGCKTFRFQCGFSKVTKWTINTVLLSII